jgi:hypothetical protein
MKFGYLLLVNNEKLLRIATVSTAELNSTEYHYYFKRGTNKLKRGHKTVWGVRNITGLCLQVAAANVGTPVR